MGDPKCVQVAVRVRPLINSEINTGCRNVLDIYPEQSQIKILNTDKAEHAFSYNYVFGPQSDHHTFYMRAIKPLINKIFEGYNLTIFAYGQTGSGKTYSMGTAYSGPSSEGVIPMAVNDIFEYINEHPTYEFTLTVSFMELYLEVLYDLLSDKPRDKCVLEIREDSHGILIPGLSEVVVTSASEVFDNLVKGSTGRATGSTNMNSQSSRSHAIFTINLTMQNKDNSAENKIAKFHFVDLAGSERPKKTGATGVVFQEGVNINKGLLVLGNVISALGDEKNRDKNTFVSYRDSNLTRLLKDSLGGNSITLMIACVSPADYNIKETLSTLRYADRARKIQNKPIINQDPKDAEILALKKQVQQLRLQIIGQGGETTSPAETELLKKENADLLAKLRETTRQLSATLHTNSGLFEKIVILQSANDQLQEKMLELKTDYDLTLGELSTGLDANDVPAMRKNVAKMAEIRRKFAAIDSQQRDTINEIFMQELNAGRRLSADNSTDIRNDEEYTTKQLALNKEIQQINENLTIKEHLARQIASNNAHMVDYGAMAENEAKIAHLEREKDELLRQLKSANGHAGEPQRRRRVQDLEAQIGELKRKCAEQARLIRLKEKDEAKIGKLNAEILQIKQARVRLIRASKEESERYRTQRLQKDREMNKLKLEDRRKQQRLVQMESMHRKQQLVLKRKVEEANALNKRLKESLALRKAAHSAKTMYAGKVDRIASWIRQEVEIVAHFIQAEVTLKGLLEDRAILQEELLKLRKEGGDGAQIASLEEDIEQRSVQIQDLQQKILDSEEEERRKGMFDCVTTMGDAKHTLNVLMEEFGMAKKREVQAQLKLTEVNDTNGELNSRVAELEQMLKLLEYKHQDDISKLQDESEEKIAVLLRQLRGIELKSSDEELKNQYRIQTEQLAHLDAQNQQLMQQIYENDLQVEELQTRLNTVRALAQNAHYQPPLTNNTVIIKKEDNEDKAIAETESVYKTPIAKIRREKDNTYVLETLNNSDLSFVDDDVFKDPDWRKTPVGAWLMNNKKKSIDVQQKSFKRTSEGSCACSKSFCTVRCGCKRMNRACNAACKCGDTCQNHKLTQNRLFKKEEDVLEAKRPTLKEISNPQ